MVLAKLFAEVRRSCDSELLILNYMGRTTDFLAEKSAILTLLSLMRECHAIFAVLHDRRDDSVYRLASPLPIRDDFPLSSLCGNIELLQNALDTFG
jgi:hypothetical protein